MSDVCWCHFCQVFWENYERLCFIPLYHGLRNSVWDWYSVRYVPWKNTRASLCKSKQNERKNSKLNKHKSHLGDLHWIWWGELPVCLSGWVKIDRKKLERSWEFIFDLRCIIWHQRPCVSCLPPMSLHRKQWPGNLFARCWHWVEGTEVSTENLYTQAIPHVCLGPQFTLHLWPESNNSNNKPQAETLVEAKWF